MLIEKDPKDIRQDVIGYLHVLSRKRVKQKGFHTARINFKLTLGHYYLKLTMV